MKTNLKRKGISQSMDLFIIIAAVLGIGGVVTASVYGLIGASSTNSSVLIVQGSVQGSATSGTITSFTITVKNSGSATVAGGTMTITLGGSKQPATPVTVPAPSGSTGTWTTGGAASSPVALTGTSVTLAPGQQVAVSLGTISGLTTGYTTGTPYTITVTYGSAQTSITLTAQ
jgi:hypothetical protein